MNAPIVTPVRRNLSFHLPKEKITYWNNAGSHFTQFMNTLSIFFPEGERLFIDSVRNYRNQITNPQLKHDVGAFIGQEAFHSREHIEYNDAMRDAGYPIDQYEKLVSILLDNLKRFGPKPLQLSVTIALEHLTAILANGLFEHPEILKDSDKNFAALWNWHALEETEHKAVAFDVYEEVIGRGPAPYLLRTSSFIIANAVFWSLVTPYYLDILRRDKTLTSVKGWRSTYRNLLGKKGVLRSVIPDWFDYFKPTFHPWHLDNRHFLEQTDALVASIEALQATSTPSPKFTTES